MKRAIRENWRVIVIPEEPWLGRKDEDTMLSLSENLVNEIKRHVDGIGDIYIDCDNRTICSHCGETWEEWEKDDEESGIVAGMPACCDKALKEWKEAGR